MTSYYNKNTEMISETQQNHNQLTGNKENRSIPLSFVLFSGSTAISFFGPMSKLRQVPAKSLTWSAVLGV